MLQKIPVRRLFRLLRVPLGLAIAGVGTAGLYLIIEIVRGDHWGFALLIPAALAICVLGVLLLIHTATNSFPEGDVGRADADPASARPDEEL